MEFENLIMKMILKYCRENNIEDMSADNAWSLAKRICIVSKRKAKKEIIVL